MVSHRVNLLVGNGRGKLCHWRGFWSINDWNGNLGAVFHNPGYGFPHVCPFNAISSFRALPAPYWNRDASPSLSGGRAATENTCKYQSLASVSPRGIP